MPMWKLDPNFVQAYQSVRPRFGFSGLGEVVYMRTYSRLKPDGSNERWIDTVQRVVEGMATIQRDFLDDERRGSEETMDAQMRCVFDRMFHMKFLPAGRGLWACGTDIVNARRHGCALFNCSFCTTARFGEPDQDVSEPFAYMMDLAMSGVGLGFDTKGAGGARVRSPGPGLVDFRVEDSRQGWVQSVRRLIQSYTTSGPQAAVQFDYSMVRPAGLPLSVFGGCSSGPEPLVRLHEDLRSVLDSHCGSTLSARGIVDMCTMIGRCVIAGNIRRTAEIAVGEYDDEEFLDLKNYQINPERAAHGWAANHSVFFPIGGNFEPICRRTIHAGEPGFLFLDNMRSFGRMGDPRGADVDPKVCGTNACGEISLEDHELCNLADCAVASHDTLEEFLETLRYAHLYAKTVTLVPSGLDDGGRTDAVIARNRRLGISITGVAQFLARHSLADLRRWLNLGYEHLRTVDAQLSDAWGVPRSIKLTTVKPSGTIGLLMGATPGMHFPISRFYIRRMRLAKASPLVQTLRAAGYPVEPCHTSPEDTVVVSFPVDVGDGVCTEASVSMWEQLSLAAFLQREWADNQVSVTVTFDPKRTSATDMARALDYFQFQLKSVSFLPRVDASAPTPSSPSPYTQLPYEPCDAATYMLAKQKLKRISNGATPHDHEEDDRFCSNETCERV